jgi:endonuclease YncB( thermonuclease family)
MLGWRKRKDGFEWREYVRTTILVRRRNRRERLAQAGDAAVQGLKAAGERGAAAGAVGARAVGRGAKAAGHQGMGLGVAGAQAFWRGAKAAGRQGMAMSVAGAHAAEDKVRAGLPKLWVMLEALGRATRTVLSGLWTGLRAIARRSAQGLAPALDIGRGAIASVVTASGHALHPALLMLRLPSIAMPLAIAGSVALLGAFVRVVTKGADRDAFIALLIGLVILGALLAARSSDGVPAWAAALGRGAGSSLRRLGSNLGQLGPISGAIRSGAAIVVVLAIVAGAGWLAWRAAPENSTITELVQGTPPIEGRATARSGDTLQIAKTTVRIAGIEAPVAGQTCLATGSRRWRCDVSAKTALSRLVRGETITCDVSDSDEQGRRLGTCRLGETDIAAELVRNGHVFAETGFFAAYSSLESEAREAKAGIWRGDAERPADYRAQKWEEAKREAPDGCPIKGNVSGGRRLYVLPWARDYERVRISQRRGERWFCTEAEARAAGWKPSGQS